MDIQAEELSSLTLEAGAVRAGSEGLDAVIADHRAEAGSNRSETDLIKSILASQVGHYIPWLAAR